VSSIWGEILAISWYSNFTSTGVKRVVLIDIFRLQPFLL